MEAPQTFSHFWKQISDLPLTFRNLQKTYVTRIRMLLGEKSKALKIHKSYKVQIDHYLNQQEIQNSYWT